MIKETIDELRELKTRFERTQKYYGADHCDDVYTLDKAIIACGQLRKARKKAKRWKRKYLEISNQYCNGVSMKIVGDKYEFRFTDGTIKVVDYIVDKMGVVE